VTNRVKAPPSAGLVQRQKWNVPDWKKEGGYPDWDTLTLNQKKWEFLRRNPRYRGDWERYVQPASKFTQKNKKFPCDHYGISQEIAPQNDYTQLPHDFHFLEQPVSGGKVIYPRPEIYRCFRNKKSKGMKLLFQENIDLVYEDEFLSSLSPPTEWYHGNVWVEFNFTENLKAQLEEAEKNICQAKADAEAYMKSYREVGSSHSPFVDITKSINKSKKSPRGAKKKLKNTMPPDILLLRVLDGVNCEQTHDQISMCLGELVDEPIDPRTIGRQYQRALSHWKILT
jgi:hypothetical protein